MATMTAPVWLLVVLGILAVCGFVGLCWVAAGAAERAADWWHDRERPVDPPWWWRPWLRRRDERPRGISVDCWYDTHEDCDGCDCVCGHPPYAPALELPPERTWEQMTSHQLPVVGMSPAERKHWQQLERARKRRARRVETTHRAHYAAMGFEYPSGLMARVREVAP